MKNKWKILIAAVIGIGLVGGVIGGIAYSEKGIVAVQTDKTVRQDLTAVVTASGEIKPRNYINIGANTAGAARLIEIAVVEGQAVRKGQLLARLESIQREADVAAQRAQLSSNEADTAAARASLRAAQENVTTLQASIDRAQAELDRAEVVFNRAQALHEERLIAQQEFDQRKAEYASLSASLREAEARKLQAEAQAAQLASQVTAAEKRIILAQANLDRAADQLERTYVVAPLDGVVTNLPVRVGETVVPGIQNSAASLIMTIADMSLITAEVKVDETDIVSVKLDQDVEITIDAIPDETFQGRVLEIGNTAILRSTGLAASQSAISSQEAKDFKVVVALVEPPPEIRPGLSCTTKVTTATREQVLTVPIQALTVRQREDLLEEEGNGVQAATDSASYTDEELKEELQGVFVVEDEQAVFREVETGITGATDIEVLSGLEEDSEIITGSYQVIRTIRNEARVKVDNSSSSTSSE